MIKRHRMILSKKTFLKKIRYISVCSKTLYIYIYILYVYTLYAYILYVYMYVQLYA